MRRQSERHIMLFIDTLCNKNSPELEFQDGVVSITAVISVHIFERWI